MSPRGTGRTSSVWRGVAVLALSVFALTGCATGGGSASTATVSPPHSTETPSPTPTVDPIEAWAEETLAAMTLEQKIASMLMLHTAGTDPATIRAMVDEVGPGGVILMGDNIGGGAAEVRSLVDGINPDGRLPLLIGIDQEGGDVERIRTDEWASAIELKSEPPEQAEAAFSERSAMLADAGVSINFGIVADVTDDPSSFIYRRALGTTPAASAERVVAAVHGEAGNVLSTLKHFPGHGAAPGDSHVSVPSTSMTYDDWLLSAAQPFEAGIDAGAKAVMFGHLVYSSVDSQPASLSPVWHSILRDDLGFDGITITDDMGMLVNTGIDEYRNPSENVIRAIAAGTTMVLYILGSVDPAVLVADVAAAVGAGRIDEEQIDDAAMRLLIERRTLGAEGQSASG